MVNPVDPALLAGLRELSESTFPKHCHNCGRVYETAADYVRQTRPVSEARSGLKAVRDDDGTVIVELFRNCECGSTLMDVFGDRRRNTPGSNAVRERFGRLLGYLEGRGIDRDLARAELLKVMRGGTSDVLRALAPPAD